MRPQRESQPRGNPYRGPALSIVGHAAIVAAMLAATMIHLPVTPTDPPSVQVVVGSGAEATGQPPPAPRSAPPAPAPSPPPAPSSSTSPAAEASVPPPPAAQPMIPPPTMTGEVPAGPAAPAAPTPPPAQQASMPTHAATASPVPPPSPTTSPRTPPPPPHAPAPTNVRLGSGIAAPIAQIADAGLVHPAVSEVGNLPPDYPPEAARRHEHGTVTIGVRVDPDGTVREARILVSSGSRWLDAAARERLGTWHFQPATRNGKPVDDIVEISINFVE